MQSIPSYIAYLLTRHGCVIVPGLGAFVVSGLERSKDKKAGLLCPPEKFLGFNPDIRHNDGLLADAVAKGENISYKDACLQISRYIDQITGSMERQTPVQMAWIGKLELSAERKLLFTPSFHLSCNADTFGFDNFYLPAISELNGKEEYPVRKDVHPEEDKSVGVYGKSSFVRRTLAVAAAIIVLLMVAIPVTDHSIQYPQMAGILSFPEITPAESEVVKTVEEPVEEVTPYYIVIASLPTKNSAQIQIEKFQKEGLSNPGLVSDGNRHRVYAAKFSDKTEANTFLTHFRNEHPQYRNAWLLVQRI